MEYNDDLLIYYIHLHNKTAYDILYEKYYRITQIILRTKLNFKIINDYDFNDLVEDCIIHLYRAIDTYRNEEGTFYMYYYSIIYNVLCNQIKEIKLRKNKLIYECQEDDTNGIFSYLSDSVNLYENYNCTEERKYLINQCKNDLENNVLYLKQEGYSYKEISELLGITVKKVDYILALAKKKYKNFCY